MKRKNTKKINIKDITLGGNNHIFIQSMTNTKTKNIKATIKQINELEKIGCEIIRVSILDIEDAMAIKDIVKNVSIPVVCDIHFNYKLALIAIENGCHAIRLNPGNIKNGIHIKEVIDACKKRNIPIRIGINAGSLPNNKNNYKEMLKLCKKEIKLLESFNFYNIVISLKSSNIDDTIKAYRLASKKYKYPLHIGLTEAGNLIDGSIKSTLALTLLLNKGIGNTIRISLTGDPKTEIYAAKSLLKNLGLRKDIPELISCPGCGRLDYDIENISKKVNDFLQTINKDIKVAVMGCIVNGPGEAKACDYGIAGNKNNVAIFKKGKIIETVKANKAYDKLINIIKNDIEKD